ncbi:MAG: hypothetical protein DMG64_17230 [Acidobacteria bacterium]|nr:MAG: hypothetical protein DMG64_17230 [Acidobacteriota bacterium]
MKAPANRRNHAGFSLLEVMITIIVLMIVMGAVFSQINQVQAKTKTESMKLDLTQESRAFVDQFARDLHMSGYPISTLYQTNPGSRNLNTAVGLVFASPVSLRFEGDVYGDGNVYSVLYTYVASDINDLACPCLRRSVVKKVTGDNWYSGPGGQSNDGSCSWSSGAPTCPGIDINSNSATIQLIDAIKVNLSTRSKQFDPITGQPAVNSVSTIAELEN